VDELNAFQPHWVLGYAQALCELATRKRKGELVISPVIVQSGAEPLDAADRTHTESAFSVELINVYASSECLYMGFGCLGEELSLFEDLLIIECLPEFTVITNLFNRTLTLIHYRLDDILVPTASQDSASPNRIIRELIVRSKDNMTLQNDVGEEDSVSAHSLIALTIASLRKLQFRSSGEEEFSSEGVLRS
jgi:phenylacetate-CoA ligase